MSMFSELVQALVTHRNIDRLKFLKQQLEAEMNAIGQENRLLEKYKIVSEAIVTINNQELPES